MKTINDDEKWLLAAERRCAGIQHTPEAAKWVAVSTDLPKALSIVRAVNTWKNWAKEGPLTPVLQDVLSSCLQGLGPDRKECKGNAE